VPELPEVEIAARNLRRWALGRTIVSADAARTARYVFRPSTPATFARAVTGARFEAIARHGKQLLWTLSRRGEPLGVLAHLGMTGKWVRRGGGEPAPRFSRARLRLDDGATLHLDDLRLFGRLRVVPGARFGEVEELRELGPDPLGDGIDRERLAALLGRSRLPVKVRIMDQRVLAGVGNILASEACFRAGIDPRRPARSLSRREVDRLAAGVLDAVRETLAREEGEEIEYVEEGGENPFLVYAREGERCPRCGRGRIARAVQAQRSTYWCPVCQKASRPGRQAAGGRRPGARGTRRRP
jgi:formamidopyrimidine-DNA glycosylase